MLELFTSFFMLGAVGFYLFLILSFVVFIRSVNEESYGLAIFLIIVGIFVYHVSIIKLIINWPMFLMCVVGYGFFGGVSSLFLWKEFLKEKITAKNWMEKSSYVSNIHSSMGDYFKREFDPTYHKCKIVGWIAFWPWVMFWKLTKNFFVSIYNWCGSLYVKILNDRILKINYPGVEKK